METTIYDAQNNKYPYIRSTPDNSTFLGSRHNRVARVLNVDTGKGGTTVITSFCGRGLLHGVLTPVHRRWGRRRCLQVVVHMTVLLCDALFTTVLLVSSKRFVLHRCCLSFMSRAPPSYTRRCTPTSWSSHRHPALRQTTMVYHAIRVPGITSI